jgi:hypothetical protein
LNIALRLSRLAIIVTLLLTTHACSRGAHGPVSIEATPPNIQVKYLDDIYWKQRTKFGRAYTNWSFACPAIVKVKELTDLRKANSYVFEVTNVDIVLALDMTQSLPDGVKEPLRKHEETHCQMSCEVYKEAPQAATEIATAMIGKKVVVTAPDPDTARRMAALEARTQITTEYKKRIAFKADELGVIFDRITNHGMNGVTNAEGSTRSFEEYAKSKKQAANSSAQPGPIVTPMTSP